MWRCNTPEVRLVYKVIIGFDDTLDEEDTLRVIVHMTEDISSNIFMVFRTDVNDVLG